MEQELDECFSNKSDVSGYYSTQTFMDNFKLRTQLMLEIMKVARYRELLFTDKLSQHCADIEQAAFEISERIRVQYLKENPATPRE